MKNELIKSALIAELKRYTEELVNVVRSYDYQTFGPERQESWALTSNDGHCVTSAGLARLIYLIKSVEVDDQRGAGIPVDPWGCIVILRALALHGDRSNPEFIDTVSLLADQCSMGFDKLTSAV